MGMPIGRVCLYRLAKPPSEVQCVQVPNAMSLGGAFLVCSCTFVLGFAEHMATVNPQASAQPHWWWRACSVPNNARSLISNWVAALWHKCSKQHDAYEKVTGDEFEDLIASCEVAYMALHAAPSGAKQ